MRRTILRFVSIVVFFTLGLNVAAGNTPQWTVYEQTLMSERDYTNPLWDARMTVKLTSPRGRQTQVEAFWFEGRTWKFRFSPDERGRWQWETHCSDESNRSLHGQSGTLECTAYNGDNPLYRHGTVQLSADRLHFQHADNTPFFFLSCTAWNGALKSAEADWRRYLRTRREQRFTAIQFVSTQWRGGRKTLAEPVFREGKRISINPVAFRRLDQRLAAINEHGLVACPVILWALNDDDPGNALPEADATRLARYIVARWGAYQVIWLLSGDCRFADHSVERWKRIGQTLFGQQEHGATRRLVTLHPSGQNWIGEKFADQSWLDFHSYQSGHGDGTSSLRWHIAGPVIDQWAAKPSRPIVNLEPNYEAHPAYQSKQPHSAGHVRRAAYWSLMIAPPAGLTYGHNAIWVWNQKPGPAEGHERLGTVKPWSSGLEAPGAQSMKVLRDIFDSGPWIDLRPAGQLLADQPGARDPNRFVTAAATTDGRWAVVYLPVGGELKLNTQSLAMPATAAWIDPRTGGRQVVGQVTGASQRFQAPDGEDWLLEIRSTAAQ